MTGPAPEGAGGPAEGTLPSHRGETGPEKLARFNGGDYTEYLVAQLVELRYEHEQLAHAYEGLRSSKTYRLGDVIARVPRALKGLLSRRK